MRTCALVLIGGLVGLAPRRGPATFWTGTEGIVDQTFAQYVAGDTMGARRTAVAGGNLEKFRRALGDTLDRWNHDRQPIQGAFLLEIVEAGLAGGQTGTAKQILRSAREFVVGRPDPPGKNPAADSLEIAWHKADVALLEGLWAPELLDDEGLSPLARRMTAEPTKLPTLVDPWIDVARGVAAEQRTLVDPRTLPKYGRLAVQHFEAASAHSQVRAEALVRKAFVLHRLGRDAEALTTLDALTGPIDDATVHYWGALVRGRVLEGLKSDDDAMRAYEDALAIVPHAPSPSAALTALALRRGDRDAAVRWAASGRSRTATAEPWTTYALADHRFLDARLATLRRAAR